MGYVDRKHYLRADSPSHIYRISETGVAVWGLFEEHQLRLAAISGRFTPALVGAAALAG